MKAEFVNPFVTAAMKALESVIGSAPDPGQPAVRSAAFTTQQISIVIGVTGAVEGRAIYGMSLVTAGKIAAAMSSMPAITFDDLSSSAFADLGSTISAHATALLAEAGYDATIAAPALVRGPNVEVCASVPALVVPLYTEFGRVEISVAVQEVAGPRPPSTPAHAPGQAEPAVQQQGGGRHER